MNFNTYQEDVVLQRSVSESISGFQLLVLQVRREERGSNRPQVLRFVFASWLKYRKKWFAFLDLKMDVRWFLGITLYLFYTPPSPPLWSFRYLLGSNAGLWKVGFRVWEQASGESSVPCMGPDRTQEHGLAAVSVSLSFVCPWTSVSDWTQTRRLLIPLRHLLIINFLRMWPVLSAARSIFTDVAPSCATPLSESFAFTEVHSIRIYFYFWQDDLLFIYF